MMFSNLQLGRELTRMSTRGDTSTTPKRHARPVQRMLHSSIIVGAFGSLAGKRYGEICAHVLSMRREEAARHQSSYNWDTPRAAPSLWVRPAIHGGARHGHGAAVTRSTMRRCECAAIRSTNTVEGTFSIFKHGAVRCIIEHCAEKHLQHCAEGALHGIWRGLSFATATAEEQSGIDDRQRSSKRSRTSPARPRIHAASGGR